VVLEEQPDAGRTINRARCLGGAGLRSRRSRGV